ncbi:hypothetical protein B0I35DRAFT_2950 [Stachybotrys elegans]|uniref:DNA mismatch repair protein PMS1 n=1 Tax=Stachybotrys elegans TaxID=80388 RepID=A0A8K0WVQ7_9HYPO|nr:hypothetical protein B0I35DRAFT_2950 [Stachybotrys elegans]
MATIKPIDHRSIHQIQSGQVIVDLCSVVKELVENSIDAGATIIDVRFKNQGLDLIEVQDNGSGISPANYASVALKHHTSKLSSYSDISTLETFGFRGEALASLCALSTFTIITCLAESVPRGSKLSFEQSGKLKDTSVVASQRGTTVSVERLFHNLPVRRRELERNIKREWQKVIALLNQYACIQTNLKFSVSQQPTKGKRIVLFSTKGNNTTRDNIINIFGAKTMTSLVPLDLKLQMQPSSTGLSTQLPSQPASISNEVRIVGHVSRPVGGEGRQTPDRQMFFVNGRPCGLPQFAKTFNEVYRSYNSNQSPFIFADIRLDTHMYDVNVSPDKRSILLHDQNRLLDTVRESLIGLFDGHDQTVPFSRPLTLQPSSDKPSSSNRQASKSRPRNEADLDSEEENSSEVSDTEARLDSEDSSISRSASVETPRALGRVMNSRTLRELGPNQHMISDWVKRKTHTSEHTAASGSGDSINTSQPNSPAPESASHPTPKVLRSSKVSSMEDEGSPDSAPPGSANAPEIEQDSLSNPTSSPHPTRLDVPEPPMLATQPTRSSPGKINSSQVPRQHLKRPGTQITSVTIGDETTSNWNSPPLKRPRVVEDDTPAPSFGNRLSRLFAAKEGVVDDDIEDDEDDEDDEGDEGDEGDEDGEDGEVGDAGDSASLTSSQGSISDREDEGEVEEPDEEGIPSPSERSQVTVLATNQVQDVDMADESQEPADEPQTQESREQAAEPRAQALQSGIRRKDATFNHTTTIQIDEGTLQSQAAHWLKIVSSEAQNESAFDRVEDLDASDAEARLALIISRSDFLRMRVAGQFNLGFIIAVRPAAASDAPDGRTGSDELFIIDQHASDEKYNFERLQSSMVVQSQRLVQPKKLELTALEEEIVLQNMNAIEANGFKVDVDMTGGCPVGSRVQLTALPLSRETTFDLSDFEELLALLGEAESDTAHIPRPSRVRKMFAMRACRSSVMIGKPLNVSQMYTLVRHMGDMDKPWNCPHGRPTMRHLCRLQAWDDKNWKGDLGSSEPTDWASYV